MSERLPIHCTLHPSDTMHMKNTHTQQHKLQYCYVGYQYQELGVGITE